MKKLFTGCYYFIYFIKSTIRCIKSDTVILVKPIIHNSPLFPKHNLFFSKGLGKKCYCSRNFIFSFGCYMGPKEQIREDRNRYLPNFKAHYDDYLQYAPAATVYGLKLAGVKGRNNIGRASLSYATSLAIMAILVNSIKYTAKVERPDGSKEILFHPVILPWLLLMHHF